MARKKRRRAPPYTQPFAAADAPNRVWCADFKGWFRTGDGSANRSVDDHRRLQPLLVALPAVRRPTTSRCGRFSSRRFANAALPEAIRTDNGAPFASRAVSGAFAPGGVVDEAGDCAGAHCGRTSGTERAARAHASHAETGDGFAAGGEPARAATSV